MITLNDKHFKLQVKVQGCLVMGRTETEWNKGNIDWCDWRILATAKDNLADFLADDGLSSEAIASILFRLKARQFARMNDGTITTL